MQEEFSDLRLTDQEIAANVEVGQRVYAKLSPVKIREPAKTGPADLFDIPYSNPVLGSPSVLHAGSAIERKTGTWRVERPVIDTDVCTRCGLCYVRCPDGAIALDDEGFPVIDYDHCKGCMICRQVCPLRAVESERETKAW